MIAMIGSAIGIAGAIGYAALIMYGLRTWWVGAVGTTALELHVDPLFLVAGAVGALVSALIALFLSMRRLARRSARTLLTAGLSESEAPGTANAPTSSMRTLAGSRGLVAAVVLGLAALLIALAMSGVVNQVAAFFGAGGVLLIAGCMGLSLVAATACRLVNAARLDSVWRGLRAVAADAQRAVRGAHRLRLFRHRLSRGVSEGSGWRVARQESGTGGFALMAESVAPLMFNPNTPAGRDELSLSGAEIERAHIARFRLRPGDEASCLTLYQPRNPRIVAPEAAFIAENRFAFANSACGDRRRARQPVAAARIADSTTARFRRSRIRPRCNTSFISVSATTSSSRPRAAPRSGCASSARWPTACCNRSSSSARTPSCSCSRITRATACG